MRTPVRSAGVLSAACQKGELPNCESRRPPLLGGVVAHDVCIPIPSLWMA